jgi:predicted nuclease of predicted toxin-antitoxin system
LVKLLLDEGLPFRLAAFLEDAGDDVTICSHDHPYALTDRDILAHAHVERRTLRTNDKDFGDLDFRDRLPHSGVILFRVGYLTIDRRIELLRATLADYVDQLNQFIVISAQGIRVRVVT